MKWASEIIRRKLALLGEDVTIVRAAGEVTVKAVISPVTSVSAAARLALETPDGVYPAGTREYIGPPEEDISEARYLRCNGKLYYVRRSERMRCGGKELYVWGLLLGGGADEAQG